MKILLSDGSSLTSRQTATQLARAGHRVEALTPDGLCLCRFTRHVARLHRVPSYGTDPLGWLDAALAVYQVGQFDALFPTQEQVAVLAHSAGRLAASGVVTAVPPFEAVRAVQDKVSAFATLGALGIPQPQTAYIGSAAALRALDSFPVFVKLPIGTATAGVRRVESAAALDAEAADLEAAGAFAGDGGVVAQQPASGPLVMVQTVFVRGELAAAHANLRVREGARGGASHKRSLEDPVRVVGPLETLGRALRWHGALSADAILTEAGPLFIDINPRLVEPANAWRSGVDLVGALLAACADSPPTADRLAPPPTADRPAPPARRPVGRGDVATHQLLVAVLGASQQGRGRRAVAAEIAAALAHTGSYRGSTEELTPARGDPRAAVPVLMATAAVMIRPALWRWFASGSVAGYALTPAGWDSLLSTPPT